MQRVKSETEENFSEAFTEAPLHCLEYFSSLCNGTFEFHWSSSMASPGTRSRAMYVRIGDPRDYGTAISTTVRATIV
jgi:hypothetical protein